MTLAAVIRFDGDMDTQLLRACLDELIERHENLRVSFGLDSDGGYVNLASSLAGYYRESVIPRGTPDWDRFSAACDMITAHQREEFDITRPPLFRVLLVRLSVTSYLLNMAMDHIIADGRSVDILVRDLLAIYSARSVGREPALPKIPAQYLDFAAWERSVLRGEFYGRHASYWKDRLARVGPIPPSGLTDPEPPGGPAAGGIVRASISGREKRQLDQLLKARGIGMVPLVSAALKAAVITKRVGMTDGERWNVGFMASAANRGHPATREAFGYFATPIVLYSEFDVNPTLEEMFEREAAAHLQALRYQAFPHALVIKELAPQLYGARHRDEVPDVAPYVQFAVEELKEHGDQQLATRELRAERIRIRRNVIPGGGLRFIGTASGERLSIDLLYRTDLYREQWAQHLADTTGHYLRLMISESASRLEPMR
ncbi:MAG: hypothetical protein J2P25_22770 [Nocardiopsaceae bacterium]|nr:hypothetical protein [Nocardiopsaceae bacterium]